MFEKPRRIVIVRQKLKESTFVFNFVMIAYNLMSLFRMFILQEKTQKTLSTLRYRTFAIGAYFEKINNKLVLKIALNKKDEPGFPAYGTAHLSLTFLLNWLMSNLG